MLLSGLSFNWIPKKFLGPCFGGTQETSVANNDLSVEGEGQKC